MPDATVGFRLEIDRKIAEAPPTETLFQAAEAVGVHVPTSCREQGKCRECLVEVEHGEELLTPPEAPEAHLPARFRLACRARFARPGTVRCHTMRRGALRIDEECELPAGQGLAIEPRFCRVGSRLFCDGQEVGTIAGPPHGVAVDIGTTTVVLRLYDLESGRPVASQSFENPQRFGGSDIMARIRWDGDHPGRLLQRVLLGYLSRAFVALPVEPEQIVELAVAGNSTMRDLFFGLDVQTIGQLPYRSQTEHELRSGVRSTTNLDVPARHLRLPVHRAARVYGLPVVSGHVGADAAACLLASGIAEGDEVVALMDIGTNTEVLLGNRERILAASCPAGPAFEGGGVRWGVPGLEGAIERVALDDSGGVRCSVIGDVAPVGICGSGLVDLLSELRRTGLLNPQGRFIDDDEDRFVLDEERGIALDERDINELAQAKGANAAGLRIVADCYGIGLQAVSRCLLAGGFARHLDPAAARRIGLVPDLPEERLVRVGNAALEGTAQVLCSMPRRRALEKLVQRVEHVSLETHPAFFEAFVDGCQLQPISGERLT